MFCIRVIKHLHMFCISVINHFHMFCISVLKNFYVFSISLIKHFHVFCIRVIKHFDIFCISVIKHFHVFSKYWIHLFLCSLQLHFIPPLWMHECSEKFSILAKKPFNNIIKNFWYFVMCSRCLKVDHAKNFSAIFKYQSGSGPWKGILSWIFHTWSENIPCLCKLEEPVAYFIEKDGHRQIILISLRNTIKGNYSI